MDPRAARSGLGGSAAPELPVKLRAAGGTPAAAGQRQALPAACRRSRLAAHCLPPRPLPMLSINRPSFCRGGSVSSGFGAPRVLVMGDDDDVLAALQALMTGCPGNLETGLAELERLHYNNGLTIIDRK